MHHWSISDTLRSISTKPKQYICKYTGPHLQSPPWFVSIIYKNLFNEKQLPYNLRASKIIIQPKCNATTHGLNSLTYQGANYGIVYQNTLKLLRVLKIPDINWKAHCLIMFYQYYISYGFLYLLYIF